MDQPPIIKNSNVADTVIGVVTLVAGSAALRPLFRYVGRWLDRHAAARGRRAVQEAAATAATIADVQSYLKDELATLRGQLAAAQTDIGIWRTHAEHCEGRFDALEAKVSLLEAQRRVDQDELARLRADRNRLESRVRDLERELDRYRRGQ